MRHKKAEKRIVEADSIYNNRLVAKFINKLMKEGKKTVAQKVLYHAFSLIEEIHHEDPLIIFEKAIQTVSPKQEVKARRVGGASYQVPIEVRGERKISLAIRWLITAAKARPSKEYHTFSEKLALEFLDASQNKGDAVKKRDTMQRMAEANRAFSHFRF